MANKFGDLLRDYRVDAGVSLITVARHLKLSVPYLSDIERNRRAPLSRQRILKVAQLLDISPECLLTAAAEQAGILEQRPDLRDDRQHTMGNLILNYHEISHGTWQEIAQILRSAKHLKRVEDAAVVCFKQQVSNRTNAVANATDTRRRSEVTHDSRPPTRYRASGRDR